MQIPRCTNYYYWCSAEGCGVKTHVERDRDDPRYIVTTYYGVHNHAVPGSGAPAAPDLWPVGDAAHSSESRSATASFSAHNHVR